MGTSERLRVPQVAKNGTFCFKTTGEIQNLTFQCHCLTVCACVLAHRVERGVVRKVHCAFSPATPKQIEDIGAVFRKEPCPLLEVDLAYAHIAGTNDGMFKGATLVRAL